MQVVQADIQLSDSSSLITLDVDYGLLRSNNNVALDLQPKTVTFTDTNANENATFEVIPVDSRYSLTLDSSKVNSLNTAIPAIGKDLILNLKAPTGVNQGQTPTIAKIHVKSATVDKTFEVNVNVLPELELNKIVVSLNGNEEKNVGSDGGSVKNIKPGDKISMRFVIDNHYDSDYNYGDVDGTIGVKLDDSDFGDTVDEETDFSINAGDKMDSLKDGVIEFNVPQDVKEGDYTADIKVEGKDQNKAKFKIQWKMTLRVQRNKDDVRIDSITLDPIEVNCAPRNIQIVTKVSNQGSNNQKHVTLNVESSSLGLKKSEDFQLDKGSSTANTKTSLWDMEVSPTLKVGTYTITASAFMDFTVPADKKTATLIVKECPTKTAASAETVNVNETTTQSAAGTQQSSGLVAVKGAKNTPATPGVASSVSNNANNANNNVNPLILTKEKAPYTAEDYLVGIIIVVVVFVLALIILCLVLLFK